MCGYPPIEELTPFDASYALAFRKIFPYHPLRRLLFKIRFYRAKNTISLVCMDRFVHIDRASSFQDTHHHQSERDNCRLRFAPPYFWQELCFVQAHNNNESE